MIRKTTTIGVIIATFGVITDEWRYLIQRAKQSVLSQLYAPDEFIMHHSDTLAKARNEAAAKLSTDWLVFLDADDELDEHYMEAILAEIQGDIREPNLIRVYPDGRQSNPYRLDSNMLENNHIVVGAGVRRKLFLNHGGFKEYPYWEDWELWLRLIYYGHATVHHCDRAIYKIYNRQQSRNIATIEDKLNLRQAFQDEYREPSRLHLAFKPKTPSIGNYHVCECGANWQDPICYCGE